MTTIVHLRRLFKFLHTMGAAGLMGAVAALVVVIILARASLNTPGYAPLLVVIAKIAAWVIGPSVVLTVITGLLAMVVNRAFQDAGWVWVKAATGLLVLLASAHLFGSIQEQATLSAGAVAGGDQASAARLLESEINTLWVLLAVSAANVALGVWRPRLLKFMG